MHVTTLFVFLKKTELPFESLHRIFEFILTNLQEFEICTYSSKDTNINILVTLNLTQDLVYFSQIIYT